MYYLANLENVWIWVAIGLVVLLLFGGSKIPEMMKGIGQGVKELKKGMNERDDDDELKKQEAHEREVKARVEEQMRREEEERRTAGIKN
jgi:sec-independent protein translocase protein TatA